MTDPSITSDHVPRPQAAEAWGSAPGRVEFIGNHTDYNGGWVLGATIDRRIDVGLSRRDDQMLRLVSAADVAPVQVSLSDLPRQEGDGAWANYVLGVVAVLRDEGLPVSTGLDVSVESELPVGAGLSSSAALELATAGALATLFEWEIDRHKMARLCRRAENEFVGVPCGILDQAVVAFGDEDQLVCIDSRTEEISTVPFPSETNLWIFRTHQAHSLAEAHYQQRHDEAHSARDRLDDLLGGIDHLADVSVEQLEEVGDELPDLLYRRARHVVTEHKRVQQVVRELEAGNLESAGDLLFDSHKSSSTDYENSTAELDFVVEHLADEPEVLGARLTGAGFGGAAMAWTRVGFSAERAEAVSEAYANRFGEELEVLACKPAPGCFAERSS